MKKIIFTLALLVQVGFAMANENNNAEPRARYENVKMFQQAGTSTAILETLSINDRIKVVRKFNKDWVIVTANGKAGYVLRSELANLKRAKFELK